MERMFVLSVFLLVSALSFSQMETKQLTGFWVTPSYDNLITYQKANQFIETSTHNGRGIHFLENEQLIVRQNAGWCGTPPVTYENVNGNWEKLAENQLKISYSNWMGRVTEIWKIEELTNEELTIEVVERKQEENAFLQ